MLQLKRWFYVYLTLSAAYLLVLILQVPTLEFFSKPLLLLPLIVAVYSAKKLSCSKFLLLALIFSWTGDVLLLFTQKDALFFILGLVAFLTAHLMLIFLFYRQWNSRHQKFKWHLPVLVSIVLYLGALLSVLFPHLGSLTPEVIVYALVISTMLFMAHLLSTSWPRPASILLFSGALSFVVSDSLLALNKFFHTFPFASLIIMATYLYAQFAIVRSCILQGNEPA